MLAAHVVGGGEPLAERRAAQRPAVAGGVADPVGEVGAPAGDPLERSGGSAASTFSANQRSTPAASIPSGASVACSAMARKHMRPARRHMALIVDFGGVLTTSIWPAFASFCESEGLAPETVRELFREQSGGARIAAWAGDRRARPTPSSSAAFGGLLGVAEHEGLIGRMFAGLRPDEQMIAAVRAAAPQRRADRPDLELLGPGDLRPGADRPLRRNRDLGRGRPAQAAARDLPARLRAARRSSPRRPSSSTTCARTAPAPRRSG